MEVPSSGPRAAPKRGAIVSIRQRLIRSLATEADTAPPSAPEARGVLSGWKAIATHVGVQTRTAQRWASVHGMPVHRYPGRKGRVFALREELDRWRLTGAGSAAAAAPAAWFRFQVPLPGWILAGLLLVACVWFGYRHFASVTAVPHGIRIQGNDLIVMDAGKKDLFTHSFETAPEPGDLPADLGPQFLTEDLNGDGRAEFLFRYQPELRHIVPGGLICFSNTGKVNWEFTPGRRIPFDRGKVSSSLYSVALFRLLRSSKRILVSGVNSPNWPCQVALLSNEGKLLAEYWHPGHLTYFALADVDRDGKEEGLLCGVNNPHEAATLVMLDLERFSRAPREVTANQSSLPAPAPGLVKKVLLFGRSCLSQKFAPFNRAVRVTAGPDGLLVFVLEGASLVDPALIYHLDWNLAVTRITPSTQFLSRHQELFTQRRLDHRFNEQELAPLQRVTVLPGT